MKKRKTVSGPIKDKKFKKSKIQFSFYTKGYGTDGTVKALILRKGRRYVVNEIVCSVLSKTKQRKINPVFVVECYGRLTITDGYASIF